MPNSQGVRFVANLLSARQELFRALSSDLDRRRNVDEECGHPTDGELTAFKYRELFERNALANKVVRVLPKECWRVLPQVYEDEDPDTTTPFEEALATLGQYIRPEESYYKGDDLVVIWEKLKAIDVLSGIGSFGVMYLGVDDGKDSSEPAVSRPGSKLILLRCFDESQVQVTQYDTDPRSPRHGYPQMYHISLVDPNNSSVSSTGMPTSTIDVHWSRIVHIADNLHNSHLFGIPRMKPVLNNILDSRKLHGGSAEMYWKGAFPGYSFETHPQLGDIEFDEEATKDMIEDYMNGLQRFLAGSGWSVKQLAPQVVDPSPQIERQIEAICIQLDIPMRIFKGSERGELSSAQDDTQWSTRIRERQTNHVTPNIIVPFIDRLIYLGVLPKPPDGYRTYWPDVTTQTEDDRAATAVKITQALVQYVQGNVREVMSPLDYLVGVIGIKEKVAIKYLEAAEKYNKDHPPPQPAANPADFEGGGTKGKPQQGPPASSGGPPVARKEE